MTRNERPRLNRQEVIELETMVLRLTGILKDANLEPTASDRDYWGTLSLCLNDLARTCQRSTKKIGIL